MADVRRVEVGSCLAAFDRETFRTEPVAELMLTPGGIPGDRHYGLTKAAASRESLFPPGATVWNRRQLTIVSEEELAAVAEALGVEAILPTWIGANLVLRGAPDLTLWPAGTRLLFPSGAGLFTLGENSPCVTSGRVVAAELGRPGLEAEFVRLAVGRRGLIAVVEHGGRVEAGERAEVRPPRPVRRAF